MKQPEGRINIQILAVKELRGSELIEEISTVTHPASYPLGHPPPLLNQDTLELYSNFCDTLTTLTQVSIILSTIIK